MHSERVPGSRSVSIGVLVAVGTYHEPADRAGVAHLTEHGLFQGTSSRDARAIARLMDDAGGQIGGMTSRDYTIFYAHVLDDFATYAIDLLGDLLLNPLFPEAALEREKRVVKNELEAIEDAPRERVHQLLRESVWGDHPLGRPLAGTPEGIAAIERQDLIYFFHRNYVPQRLVIAAAGNVDHDDFVAQVRDAFWRLLGSAVDPVVAPPIFKSAEVRQTAALSQAYFALGLEAPEYAAPERYAVHLLNQVIGSGSSSRLTLRLREELGLVYEAQSSYDAYRQAGLWSFSGVTTPAALDDALAVVMTELNDLASGRRPVDEEELVRAKRQLKAQVLLAAESTHTKMSRLLTHELYFGRTLPETELAATLENLDLQDLAAAAEGVLRPALDKMALAVVGP